MPKRPQSRLKAVRLKIVVSETPVFPEALSVTKGSVRRAMLSWPNAVNGTADRNWTTFADPSVLWRSGLWKSCNWNDISEAVGSFAACSSD